MTAAPRDDNNVPALLGYDATGHQVVAAEAVSVTTDSTNNVKHGSLNVNVAQFGASAVQFATADAVPQANVIEIALAAYSPGSGIDRLRTTANGDGVNVGVLEIQPMTYNGSNHDQLRGNIDSFVLLTSGVISANSNSFDATNYNGRGVKLFVATGSFGAGESTMTVTIQGKDPVSNNYYAILTSASLSANSFTVLSVYPGLTAVANSVANDVLPRTWRVIYQATNWGTGGSTLGIACAMII